MNQGTLSSMMVLAAAAVLAPLLAHRLQPRLLVPTVVLEILLGILVGPQLLGWAHEDAVIGTLADAGLAMLMCMAGYEIDFSRVRGKPLRLAAGSWVISLGAGLLLAILLHGVGTTAMVVGLCLTTTALGTVLPMVRDAGLTATPFGARVLAVGAVGEFAPIIAVTLLLTTDRPLHATVLLSAFMLIAFATLALARRPRSARLHGLLKATLGTSAQLAVRLTLFIVLALVWIAGSLGLDMLLGAFTAGIVIRLAVSTIDDAVVSTVESKLEGVGFGFLIPIFFVVSGMNFDLRALDGLGPIAKLLLFLMLFLVVRGLPVFVLFRHELPGNQREALALFAAAGLPLIVVLTGIGVKAGALDTTTAAALVAAGALSVMIYPMLALRRVRPG